MPADGDSPHPSLPGLQQLAVQLISSGIAPSTAKAYKRVWDALHEFCIKLGQPRWAFPPVAPATILRFLANKFATGSSGATLTSYTSAFAYVHKLHQWEDPTATFAVRKLLAGAHRQTPKADVRLPISSHLLEGLIQAIQHLSISAYAKVLLACTFSMAFHGFFRIGELIPHSSAQQDVVVARRDVIVSQTPIKKVQIQLRNSKTGNQKQPFLINLSPSSTPSTCPVLNLTAFLELRGNKPGPLLSYPGGDPVSRTWFTTNFQACLRYLGLDTDRFKGHSFRIGAATEAAARGLSDAQIRHLGRWRSEAFKSYIRLN